MSNMFVGIGPRLFLPEQKRMELRLSEELQALSHRDLPRTTEEEEAPFASHRHLLHLSEDRDHVSGPLTRHRRGARMAVQSMQQQSGPRWPEGLREGPELPQASSGS